MSHFILLFVVRIMENYDIIKSDFNEIAELGSDPKWNHNNCYFPYLLRQIPSGTDVCLDIGCGKGELSALLAKRANRVIAVDLADKMIEYARSNNSADNIEYICGNILDMVYAPSSFDIIITTATAHHLPYDWLLEFAKEKLRPGGKLIILDLAKPGSITDYIVWGFASIPNIIMNLIKNGRLHKDDPHTAEVWRKHGQHDSYMTIGEIRNIAALHISNAKVQRKLFWRYILIWEKR
jgi:SAM-dependent methyltransferase